MHVENMKGWTGRGTEGTEQRVMDTQHKKPSVLALLIMILIDCIVFHVVNSL